MTTQVLSPSPSAIQEAAKLIQTGQLVAMPTETVYGLGANALNADAVNSIFAAKGRPSDNPLILHISRKEHIRPLISGTPSGAALRLMEAFWPGPMTLVFPKSKMVPYAATAGLETVAIRMPSHPVAKKLIDACYLPIAAPSANRSGRPSPTTAQHVQEDFDGIIPLILDGGPCEVGLESTVIDVTGQIPRVLRPGGITPDMIKQVAGAVEVDDAVLRALSENEKPSSPGMKYKHYAPRGKMVIVQGEREAVARQIAKMYDEAEGSALILAMQQNAELYGSRRLLNLGSTPEEVAENLFDALRKADNLNAEFIISEAVEATGIGLAVMNRLGRAAAFHMINAE